MTNDYKYFKKLTGSTNEVKPGLTIYNFDGERITAGFFTLNSDPEEAPHAHEQEQINIVLSGKMLMTVGDEPPTIVEPGSIIIIPPNVLHTGTPLEPTIQLNFSSPPRGKSYADFLRGVMKE